jgi:hypothetical protein
MSGPGGLLALILCQVVAARATGIAPPVPMMPMLPMSQSGALRPAGAAFSRLAPALC